MVCDGPRTLFYGGSPAVLGPSGSHPWLLEGSEDPWFSVPVFRRVWLCLLLCFIYTPSRLKFPQC
jgi:hypothetical protein